MKYVQIIAVFSIFFISGGCVAEPYKSQQLESTPKTTIKQDNDKTRKALDQRAILSGFQDFDSGIVRNDDLEIRIWSTGGLATPHGIVMFRENQKWSAFYLPPLEISDPKKHYLFEITDAVKDWPRFLEQLGEEKALENTNDSGDKTYTKFNDGQIVILQYKAGDGRKVEYSSVEPCAQDNESGRKLCAVVGVLHEQFDIELIRLPPKG